MVGVLRDDQLNWNEHTQVVSKKLARGNYGLARAKKILPTHIKLNYLSVTLTIVYQFGKNVVQPEVKGSLNCKRRQSEIFPWLHITIFQIHYLKSVKFSNTMISIN